MADWGSFFLSAPDHASAGSEPTTVTVPGNATEVVARATGTLISVAYADDNTVLVTMPSTASYDDMALAATQLQYIFGAFGTNDLGWLTVTAKGILGLADSSDVGPYPDYIPIVGFVTLTPSLARPIRLISSGEFLAVASITVSFDSDGELAFDGVKNVRLIAPQWTNLSNTTWVWNADIKPGPGQSWPAFSVTFTGTPGTVINLATLVG